MQPDAGPSPFAVLTSRRGMRVACAALVLISLACLATLVMYTEHAPTAVSEGLDAIRAQFPISRPQAPPLPPPPPTVDPDPFGPKHVLRGPPTPSFRDNLLPAKQYKYITSWLSAGWTNDVYTYINLIYLGLITDRVPVVPMFIPSHIGGHVPPIPFGEVFDVQRLRNELGTPVLEWRDVKDVNSTEIDELGCWNIWEAVQYREAFPRRSRIPDDLGLDISYTQAPKWVKMIPNFEHDQHVTFWSLATLAFPTTRKESLVEPKPSPKHNISLPPDEHLLCYDYLYYVSAHQPFEMEYDYSPAWRYVGRHMYWTPALNSLADQYIRKAFGIVENGQIPPFISVHVRHLDFEVYCEKVPLNECFASLKVIGRRVREVQEEVAQRTGITVTHVLVTSDEKDTTWWDDVSKLGWFFPDHSETKKLHGDWYPVLIDAVIQSRGAGFVGTDRSTMSIIAARRVQDWHDGPIRQVKWGTPNADDH